MIMSYIPQQLEKERKEHNARQIALMEQRIKEYTDKKITIDRLISDLEGLIYHIQEPPKDFVDEYISAWSNLELTYACALDESRDFFTTEDTNCINKALSDLQKLINIYKKEYLSDMENETT
jgi:hypothetical protein